MLDCYGVSIDLDRAQQETKVGNVVNAGHWLWLSQAVCPRLSPYN